MNRELKVLLDRALVVEEAARRKLKKAEAELQEARGELNSLRRHLLALGEKLEDCPHRTHSFESHGRVARCDQCGTELSATQVLGEKLGEETGR